MAIKDSLDFWTEALQLEGFRVAHVRRERPSDPVRLTVVPTAALAVCPHCQHACNVIHRRHESYPLKDLPLGAQAIELVVRTDQFDCARCGHFFTPATPAFAPGAHATERFLAQAARLIRCSDIANAAAFYGVPEKTLERWYYDYVERQGPQPAAAVQPIGALGIDELRLKKKPSSTSP
jgi:transposase